MPAEPVVTPARSTDRLIPADGTVRVVRLPGSTTEGRRVGVPYLAVSSDPTVITMDRPVTGQPMDCSTDRTVDAVAGR